VFPGIFAAECSPLRGSEDEVRDEGQPRTRAPHPDIGGADVEGSVEGFEGEDDGG
jgi:hypothetical protein